MAKTHLKASKPEYWYVPIEHTAMMDKAQYPTYEEAYDAVEYIIRCGKLPYGGATKVFTIEDLAE